MPPKKKAPANIIGADGGSAGPSPMKIETDKKAFSWSWNKKSSIIYGDGGTTPSTKIAAFDMDDTITRVKSGAKFPKSADDWVYWDDVVPKKIKEFHDLGYKIVIFTNQNGISKGHTPESNITKKVEALSSSIGVPIQCFIASQDDENRKPCLGMWKLFLDNNGGKDADLKNSFYCGDAAGRDKGKGKKDFSDSDYKFAINIGIPFKTPEMFFLDEKEKLPKLGFNPKNVATSGSIFKNEVTSKVEPRSKEMIIFVGSVGSGKSTFWKNHLSGYVRINRDTLKTKEKCLKVAEEALAAGQSVVIDNQNTKKEDRQAFIELAKRYKYDLRAFYFETEKDLCLHNDTQRDVNKDHKHLSGKVGKIPIHTFFKNVEIPTTKEGFSEVKTVNFVAVFDNKADEEAYTSFSRGK